MNKVKCMPTLQVASVWMTSSDTQYHHHVTCPMAARCCTSCWNNHSVPAIWARCKLFLCYIHEPPVNCCVIESELAAVQSRILTVLLSRKMDDFQYIIWRCQTRGRSWRWGRDKDESRKVVPVIKPRAMKTCRGGGGGFLAEVNQG
jgi:hypothetical protein